MCGIAVVAGGRVSPKPRLQSMLQAQCHRGPDAEALVIRDDVGLAFSRLAIIDLSAAAMQPMCNAGGTARLIFNGEIYNYRELRQELGDYPFRTQSDAEVLLAAYERWGEACLDRFIGMFAFAIWDERTRTLFAARDRFGVKPLYYATAPDGALLIASEITALHAAGVPREPDRAAWSTYFVHGMYDHGETTFWSGVRRLLPGSSLRLTAERGLQIARWYDAAERVNATGPDRRCEQDVSDELLALLEDTVRLRFRSDVPVGICLSGGLDSSLLFGLIARTQPDAASVKAFTFYCDDPAYDERRWVEPLLAVSPRPWYPTRLRDTDVPGLTTAVQRHQDEPWGGFPTLGMATVHAAARDQGVVVLLDGNGLDEAWGGYEYYERAEQQTLTRGPVQGATSPAAGWLRPDFAAEAMLPQVPPVFADALSNVQYRDLAYAKIPRAMRFSDRVSMMFSRELREPFLDHRIVELGLRQPAERKIRNGQGKWLVRRLAQQAGLIDPRVIDAPKRPVQTPQREWLRGSLAGWADEYIEAALAGWGRDWLDGDGVRREWRQYRAAGADSSFGVWQWLSLGLAQHSSPAVGASK